MTWKDIGFVFKNFLGRRLRFRVDPELNETMKSLRAAVRRFDTVAWEEDRAEDPRNWKPDDPVRVDSLGVRLSLVTIQCDLATGMVSYIDLIDWHLQCLNLIEPAPSYEEF